MTTLTNEQMFRFNLLVSADIQEFIIIYPILIKKSKNMAICCVRRLILHIIMKYSMINGYDSQKLLNNLLTKIYESCLESSEDITLFYNIDINIILFYELRRYLISSQNQLTVYVKNPIVRQSIIQIINNSRNNTVNRDYALVIISKLKTAIFFEITYLQIFSPDQIEGLKELFNMYNNINLIIGEFYR